jgi:outer membrane protein OmpA-like peptidoglycan-associated protein
MKSKNREFGMKKKQGVLLHRSMMGLLLSASSLALGACGTMGSAWDDATSVFSSSAPYAGDIKPTVNGAPAEEPLADKAAKGEQAPPPAVPAPPVTQEQVAAAPPAPEPQPVAAEPVPAPVAPAEPEQAPAQEAAAAPAPAPEPATAAEAAPAVPAYVPDNLRYLNGSGSATSAADAAASQPYPNLAEVPPRPAPGPTKAQQQQEIADMQAGTAAAAATPPAGAVMPAPAAAPQATPLPVMPEIPALAGAVPSAPPPAAPATAAPAAPVAEPMPAGPAPAPVTQAAPASVADVYQRALNQRYRPGMAPVPPRVDPLLPPPAMAAPASAAIPAPVAPAVMGPAALQVYFGNGGSKLAAADLSRLSQLAERQKGAVARVKVTGYSSADGGGDAVTRAVRSLQLATDRANAVARQLVIFGVDPTMIEVEAATLPAGTAGKDGRRADIALSQ